MADDVPVTHPFRFGLVAAPRGTGEQWIATARRAADRGFGTLLVPDGLALHAPIPALAVAATAVPSLRVCPFVLAAPLRIPRAVAWEAHSMSALTHGRFELGLGTGRPQAAEEAAAAGDAVGERRGAAGPAAGDGGRGPGARPRPAHPAADRRRRAAGAGAGGRRGGCRHPRRASLDPATAGRGDGGPGAASWPARGRSSWSCR